MLVPSIDEYQATPNPSAPKIHTEQSMVVIYLAHILLNPEETQSPHTRHPIKHLPILPHRPIHILRRIHDGSTRRRLSARVVARAQHLHHRAPGRSSRIKDEIRMQRVQASKYSSSRVARERSERAMYNWICEREKREVEVLLMDGRVMGGRRRRQV